MKSIFLQKLISSQNKNKKEMPLVLHLFIFEGKDIKLRQSQKSLDTCLYLSVETKLNIQRTQTISKSVNPQYNSYHKFILPKGMLPKLAIRAIRILPFSVQCIAKTHIYLSCLNIGPVIEDWYELKHIRDDSIHPQVKIKMQIISDGFPMFKTFTGTIPEEDLPPLLNQAQQNETEEEKNAYGQYVEVDDSFSDEELWEYDYEYVEDYDTSDEENDSKPKEEKKTYKIPKLPLEKWKSIKFVPVEKIDDDSDDSYSTNDDV